MLPLAMAGLMVIGVFSRFKSQRISKQCPVARGTPR
jgi:hypothetical protein